MAVDLHRRAAAAGCAGADFIAGGCIIGARPINYI